MFLTWCNGGGGTRAAQLLLTQAFNSLYERGVLEALRIKYDYTFLLAILDIKHIFFLIPRHSPITEIR